MEPQAFLRDLALVLCVAAVTSVLFQRLRLPAVPGYIVAGLVIGPHVPVPLVADVATVQIRFESGAIATIAASRATEEKIRTLAITQPDAYIVLDYTEQDIHIYKRAAQEYTMNRGSIRYRRASFVEHLKVHRDNPLKLEIQHLIGAARRRRAGEPVAPAEPDDLRSLAMALEIERMIRDGIPEVAWREPC